MFINQPERDKRQTIDEERDIILKFWARSRESVSTFMLTVKGVEIPFMATFQLFPKDETGVTPMTWNVFSMGWGSYSVPFPGAATSRPVNVEYEFSSIEEKRKIAKIVREALFVFGDSYGKMNVVVKDVVFNENTLPKISEPKSAT